jgi:hypothetical protein
MTAGDPSISPDDPPRRSSIGKRRLWRRRAAWGGKLDAQDYALA